MNLNVDQQRLHDELQTLATFSEPPAEGAVKPGVTPEPATAVTRIVFTERDREARAWLAAKAQAAGLSTRVDAVGNTFFRWDGSSPELPAVATGSHIDAIPNAGMYDGTVGVLGGLEAIRALQASGFQPKRSIELILFTSEEPTRFGIGCLGSRLMSGTLTALAAESLRDKNELSLDQARAAAGFTGPISSVLLKPGHYARFVELHIEQGPLLERDGIPIGMVTHIAAPASSWITIEGEGGHAGAMLMPIRRDALAAAAEIILAVEDAALETAAIDTVATVGICDVFPGNINSVPSRVRLSLDVRDTDLHRRDFVLSEIEAACVTTAQRRNVVITTKLLNADRPATCDPIILDAIQQACDTEQIPSQPMVSRAYHDSSFMARLCPVAMIFIPCRNGVSHRPDEYAKPEDIAIGTRILARTLAALSTT
jgi:N-carbamoyl-L-amino-acid hydrolase